MSLPSSWRCSTPPHSGHVGLVATPVQALVSRRVEARYHQQMADGFLEETRALLTAPQGMSRTARQALGYAELIDHLTAGTPLDEALDLAIRRTRRFARRQHSWFRRDPRIRWLHALDDPLALLPGLRAELAGLEPAPS